MKQKDLAKKARITESMVSQMLTGKKAASEDLSVLLEAFTGIPAKMWRSKKVSREYFKNHFHAHRLNNKAENTSKMER